MQESRYFSPLSLGMIPSKHTKARIGYLDERDAVFGRFADFDLLRVL